jgi:hypothetical protein
LSYTKHSIKVYGKAYLNTVFKRKEIAVMFYVVDSYRKPLIIGSIAQELGLIPRIHSIKALFQELEKMTGTLPCVYSLKIDPTVPPVVHGPRRLPQALIPEIIAKLKEMEAEGHIKRIQEPTDWVSSMVVVKKKDKIRICIDPKDLTKQ